MRGLTTRRSSLEHPSREENLLAAKRAVRTRRLSHMNRVTGCGVDTIDIVVGSEIIERHVCRSAAMTPAVSGRPFRVEELALYQ